MPKDRYVVHREAGRLVLSGPYDAAKAPEARDYFGGRIVRATSKRSAIIAAKLGRR